MSIRTCAWPDCSSRFPTDQGPSMSGWKIFASPAARILLCPFHSELEHAPTVVLRSASGYPTRFSCLCEAWMSRCVDSLVAGVMEWREHVSLTLREKD